jgi:hypothetical protein
LKPQEANADNAAHHIMPTLRRTTLPLLVPVLVLAPVLALLHAWRAWQRRTPPGSSASSDASSVELLSVLR